MRRFAIGDIHGCRKTFEKLLTQINLQRGDIVFLLGDLIDRGPDSVGVLDVVLSLQSEGFDLRPLRGNHEQLLLDALSDDEALRVWKGNGGYATLQEFGVAHPSELPERYLRLFSALPLIVQTPGYVLVHAGLDFGMADPLSETSQSDLLWTRDYKVDQSKIAGLTLVTGHNVTPFFEIEKSLTTNHIKLDNGCHRRLEMSQGALVGLDLDLRKLLVERNCE